MILENSILTPRQKLDIISRNLAEGVIIINDTGIIEEWNEYMINKSGYSREEITGKKIWDIQYSILPRELKKKYTLEKLHDIWMNFLFNLNETGFVRKEGQFISRNNETVLTEDVICRIRLQNKNFLYVIQRDRADKNKSNGILLSILTLQLRSLISGMSDFTGLFLQENKSLNIDNLLSCVKKVMSSTEKSISMLENLLVYSSAQAGSLEFKPVRTSINPMLEGVIRDYKNQLSDKNIQLNFNPEGDIHCIADRTALRIILSNLVDNAVKFSNEHGKVELHASVDKNFIKITVSDKGCGISKLRLKKLFPDDLSTAYSTNGNICLGLILCKTLVEKHGGKIWAESKVNKGSEFMFTIPA